MGGEDSMENNEQKIIGKYGLEEWRQKVNLPKGFPWVYFGFLGYSQQIFLETVGGTGLEDKIKVIRKLI